MAASRRLKKSDDFIFAENIIKKNDLKLFISFMEKVKFKKVEVNKFLRLSVDFDSLLITKYIVETLGVNPAYQNNILLETCVISDRINILKYLMTKESVYESYEFWSAICYAVNSNKIECIKLLIKAPYAKEQLKRQSKEIYNRLTLKDKLIAF